MDVDALTFDVFGTVVDWRRSIAREIDAFAAQHGFDIDSNAFALAWRARYQPAMERVRSGDVDFVKLDVLHRSNLDDVLDEFGMDWVGEADRVDLNLAWHRLDPWPDVVEGLGRLKTRFILATLSNGNVALMVNMAKWAGLPWDVILGAEVARHYKPQPEAYRLTADFLGLAPERCMMVAAHEEDLRAASACGFRTAYVRRPTEYDDGGDKAMPGNGEFDLITADFVDLAQLLET
jgi:2-haloacid dehalogenase